MTFDKEAVGELKSYGTFIIDDDFLERRYGSVEHDTQEDPKDNKKSLEETQEIIEDRASVGEGYLQPEADGSTKPVVETTTFEQTVTSHPTSPYRYLHFSTNFEEVQRRQYP